MKEPSPPPAAPAGLETRLNGFPRFLRYFTLRLLTIAATIAVSIFLVVLLMNISGFIDEAVADEIYTRSIQYVYLECTDCPFLSPERQNEILEYEISTRTRDSGLLLPWLPRHLRWTWNILTFDWKEIRGFYGGSEFEPPQRTFWALTGNSDVSQRALAIVLQYFPNTLLIIGTAFFFVFVIGLPLSLGLSRRHASRLDRLLTALAPISSVPSWAHGVLLVSIFAFQLHWLPSRGMYDPVPASTPWGAFLAVLRHMLLPVLAILLSMFFQVIYAWRSGFILYAGEDYVEVGIAKGLSARRLQRDYILRPTLPYAITSFALLLLGFWQLTTALEYYFNWPGIGFLYIQAIQTGDLIVSLGIVVIFAYLLGAIMLVLDLACALADPGIRIGPSASPELRPGRQSRLSRRASARVPLPALSHPSPVGPSLAVPSIRREPLAPRLGRLLRRLGVFLRELLYYPSAVFGLGLIILFLVGAFASIFFILTGGREAWQQRYTYSPSRYDRPAFALPTWVNWFRLHDLPATLQFDSRQPSPGVEKAAQPNSSGGENITITYTFDLPDGDFPEEILLYFHAHYAATMPFVTPVWVTPDGREIPLASRSTHADEKYSLSEGVPRRCLNPAYQQAADVARPGIGGFAPFTWLLSDPGQDTPSPVAGRYTLRLEAVTFEPASSLDAELLILGRVYGPAGTDNLRRDLSIPLVTGLPVALGIGLLGALVTSLVSMLIAAVSAWFGGWVDFLAQRFTEFNMILPVLAVGVLLSYYFGIGLLPIIAIVVLLNAFGGTSRLYRAVFLQVRESPYIEAARSYGATNRRIIFHYLVPRILPVLLPQWVALIPGYVFLEATLSMFGVIGLGLPTWGGIIYDALYLGASRGHFMWVLQPVVLLLLVGLAFSMVAIALESLLNPRLRTR